MNKKTLSGILAAFVLSFGLAAGLAIKFGGGSKDTAPPAPESSEPVAPAGTPLAADTLLPADTQLLAVKTGGKYGFVDTTGKFVINPQFDLVSEFGTSSDRAIAKVGELYGLIDKAGAFAVNPQFDVITHSKLGDAWPVLVGDKWGLIDSSGKFLINPQYIYLDRTAMEDRLLAFDGAWLSLVDKSGRVIGQHQFGWVGDLDPVTGLVGAELDDVVGVLDKDGKFVVGAPDLEWIGKFDPTTRLAPATTRSDAGRSGGVGYINAAGRFVISPRFDEASHFHGSIGLAAVKVGGKWGLIDKTGKLVVRPQFEAFGPFDPVVGLLPAKTGGRWGFVDRTGNFVINPQFAQVAAFEPQSGLAVVPIGDKAGYIDKTGKLVINPQFDTARDFSAKTGLARVTLAGKEGFIDTTGKFVINPQFDSVSITHKPSWLDVILEAGAKGRLAAISGRYQRYRDEKPDSRLAAIVVSPSEAGMVEIAGMARNSADEAPAAIKGTFKPEHRLRYSDERCKLIMTFTPHGMKARGYEGDCGGVSGVTFDGTYRKVDEILDTTASKPDPQVEAAPPSK